MKRPSPSSVSIFAIFCLCLVWLRPIQAINTQSQSGSATQPEHSSALPSSRAGVAGHWILQTTGDAVDIDETGGRITARINGVEWELEEAAAGFVATRVLTREDARSLFPDIADAPDGLAGEKVTLMVARGPDRNLLDMSLMISPKASNRRTRQPLPLMSGALARVPVEPNLDTGVKMQQATTEVIPQVISAPTMSVFPSPAPNAFGSPSFSGYTSNAISALGNGQSAIGNPAATPTAYYRVMSLDDRGNIVTGFPSWKGLINPATNFGAAFGSELGNRVHFGLHIVGNGTKFKLSNLQFHMHGTDAGDLFAFDGDFSTLSYSATRVGINYGMDGIKGTADDITITSGPATQPIDELMYVGVGNALAPDDVSCPGTSQATLDCIKAVYDGKIPFRITTTYNLFDDSALQIATASGTVDFGNCVSISGCPTSIVTRAPFGQMSVAVSFASPVGSSACGESVPVSCVPASGSQFPLGVTTVVCAATDAGGNKATCSFTVTVSDIVLQDVNTGDVLLINSKTGDYSFTRCGSGGFTLTGKGSIRIVNGILVLSDIQATRRVSAMFLSNQLTGRATIVLQLAPGVFQTFVINSMNINPSITCPH